MNRLVLGILLGIPLALAAQEAGSPRDNDRLPEGDRLLIWDGPPTGVRRAHPHPRPPHFHDERERWPNGPPSPAVQMQQEQARKYRDDHNLPEPRHRPSRRDSRQVR